jgi:hypothetical protein
MDDPSLPESDTFDALALYRMYLMVLGWVAIVGGVVVMTTGYQWHGTSYSGIEIGIQGIMSGALMLGLAALMRIMQSMGECTRATQIALRALADKVR